MSRKNTPEHFFARGQLEGDCLVWTGHRNVKGYGVSSWHGRRDLAHRIAYRLTYGELPTGTEIDHLCRNRGCILPSHLEAVTHQVNIDRAPKRLADACTNGHLYTPETTGRTNGHRSCRICSRASWHRNYKPHARTSWPKGVTGSHTSRNVGDNNPNSKAWKARVLQEQNDA